MSMQQVGKQIRPTDQIGPLGIRDVLKKQYRRFFLTYEAELEKAVVGCETLLDVGCGSGSPIRSFSSRVQAVGVDAYAPAIEVSRAAGIHQDYRNIDVLSIQKHFGDGSFDCVLASDLIEHLTKEQGYDLLSQMERIARKKVIVFTPNGFVPQTAYDGNEWQVHKSGWTPEEMAKRGYTVVGINGWKPLRGELSLLKWRPKRLWQLISDITQHFTRTRPSAAFQILCIKNLG